MRKTFGICGFAHQRDIYPLYKIYSPLDSWRTFDDMTDTIRSSRCMGASQMKEVLQFIQPCQKNHQLPLQQSRGWWWTHHSHLWTSWHQPAMHCWQAPTSLQPYIVTRLNQRWSTMYITLQRQVFWRKLWTRQGHPCSRLLMWRVLQHGYYTNVQGGIWLMCADICPLCLQDGETTIHLSSHVGALLHGGHDFGKPQWIVLIYLQEQHFFKILLLQLQHFCSPTLLILMAHFQHSLWEDQNHFVFCSVQTPTPIANIFHDVVMLLTLNISHNTLLHQGYTEICNKMTSPHLCTKGTPHLQQVLDLGLDSLSSLTLPQSSLIC